MCVCVCVIPKIYVRHFILYIFKTNNNLKLSSQSTSTSVIILQYFSNTCTVLQ